MTAAQMKSEFLIRYDALSNGAPAWEDTDIEHFLNIAQLNIVRELVAAKRYDLLLNIWREVSLVIDNVQYSAVIKKAELPLDYLYYISSKSYYYKLGFNGEDIRYTSVHEEILSTQIEQFLPKNAIDYILFRTPKCYLEGGYLNVIYDSFTEDVSDIYITYIKLPENIKITTTAVNSELDESLHKPIVENAVQEALKAIIGSKLRTEQ